MYFYLSLLTVDGYTSVTLDTFDIVVVVAIMIMTSLRPLPGTERYNNNQVRVHRKPKSRHEMT